MAAVLNGRHFFLAGRQHASLRRFSERRKVKSFRDDMVLKLAQLAAPHLSKTMGLEAPVTTRDMHWSEDPRGVPHARAMEALMQPATNVRDFRLVEEAALSERMKNIEGMGNKLSKELNVEHRPIRMLCMDGGGVRGILTVNLLIRIMKHNPKFLANTDALFGTSIGGILCLLLAMGYDPEEADHIFRFCMPHIFHHDPYRKLNPFTSKYSDKPKEELMKHFFGNVRMGELKKLCTVVSFRLDGRRSETNSFFNREGWRPAILSNMPMGQSKVRPDTDLPVWEAAMMTSAAPTYFPVFKGYTDGGLVANNPSILALSKVMAHFPEVNTRNAVLFSLGAGHYPRHTEVFSKDDEGAGSRKKNFRMGRSGNRRLQTRVDWGIKQWIPFLLDILLDGDSITTGMVMHHLLSSEINDMYLRYDPKLPTQTPLDDIDAVDDLSDFAHELEIEQVLNFIDRYWQDTDAARDKDSECATIGDNAFDSGGKVYSDAWLSAAERFKARLKEKEAAQAVSHAQKRNLD